MFLKVVLFLSVIYNIQSGLSIMYGQKISIQRVPFIVLGQGLLNGLWCRFSGIIIDEKLVLTIAMVANEYKNISITVGVANIKVNFGETFAIKRWVHNGHVAILELEGYMQFNDRVQKASLMEAHNEYTAGRLLYVAGYGSVNWFNANPDELHFINAYTSYIPMQIDWLLFYLTGKNATDMSLGNDDVGGPVWDWDTGEVVGLLLDRCYFEKHNYHRALLLANHRQYIDETILKMYDRKLN